jgi:hypothetical protein
MSDLPTPPTEAVELVRAWLNGESLECYVRAGVFADAALWGTVLADLARYVAQGLKEEEGKDEAETLRVIREAFIVELKES